MKKEEEFLFFKWTVAQEAGGESYTGKLAVAYSILNRGGNVVQTVFKPWQYSAWNVESPTRGNMVKVPAAVADECEKACRAAMDKTEPDPTNGANHYLNEVATRKGRKNGDLPAWFDESKVTVRIGNHTFLKL